METWHGSPSPTSGPALSCPAGNCVVLKPSEISKNTERVLVEVLPRYLDRVSRAGGPHRLGGTQFQPHSCLLWVERPRPSHHPSRPEFPS